MQEAKQPLYAKMASRNKGKSISNHPSTTIIDDMEKLKKAVAELILINGTKDENQQRKS
jgi:hypothetical protein